MFELPNEWAHILNSESNQNNLNQLYEFYTIETQKSTIYPPCNYIFESLKLTSFKNTRVVILGQDPYHQTNQAHGLAFSVLNAKIPPSLKNIFKELQTDCNITIPYHGNLSQWATQGILLLNTILTVKEGAPNSHKNKGWEQFTDHVITTISKQKQHVVFLLWGNNAHQKEKLIDISKHCVLKAAHPSPLARGAYFGCKHFSKTNHYLQQHNLRLINWGLNN